jgi:hypothetical protein
LGFVAGAEARHGLIDLGQELGDQSLEPGNLVIVPMHALDE